MITFNAMRKISAKRLIIGAVLLGLSACSTVRLGYDNGPSLALWWLDGYLDLDRSQEAALRPELERWFAWHRATQLPDYAEWLARWQARAGGPVTGAEVCAWTDVARERLQRALDEALPAAARLLPQAGEAQWRALEKRLAERQDELRRDFLQPRPAERQAAALARAVDRAERLYGPLTSEQRALLAASTAASPFDPERWLGARQARQQAMVQALRRLQQADADVAQRSEALRALARSVLRPLEGEDGALQTRWQAHQCEASARLHEISTPAQREHLRQRLAAWEEDLRALAAAAVP